MIDKFVALIVKLALFFIWSLAYFMFVVGASLMYEGDVGGFLVAVVFGALAWYFGLRLYKKRTSTTIYHNLHVPLYALALMGFVVGASLLSIGIEMPVVILCFVLTAINLIWAKTLSDRKRKQSRRVFEPSKKMEPEARKVILAGCEHIQRMRQIRVEITDPAILDQLHNIGTISVQIIEYVEKHPQQHTKLNKFMDYYLPTTMQFLEDYLSFSQKAVKGENIQEAMAKIPEGLSKMETAFEEQLNNLYADKVLDIDSEIAVLQQKMTIEGLGSKDTF